LTLRDIVEYNTSLGDALHRRECTLKNSKPTTIKRRKIDQKLNARDSFSSGRQFAYALA